MARPKKKGTSGQAKNFITRTQAVRKLQVSLPDFRRLCIFKGIYPRQPRNRQKAAKNSTPSTTFYYAKDIQYLLHEPLLAKFREHNALAKKIAKALGKGQDRDAARLERNHAPRMTLDHIVKERYPTFSDALRDLDDALSMLFLFANLPSHMNIPPKTIRLCQRLCHEFQHFLIITHSLRRSFLSIKGIYYQASILGQDVLWLVPYTFVQRVTGDIDFRIMGTFVEFYTTLLGFVNYRLFTTAGLVYPPKFNATSDEMGAALDAFTPQARQITTAGGNPNPENKGKIDKQATARAQAIVDAVSVNGVNQAEPDADEKSDDDEDADRVEADVAQPAFRRQVEDADEIVLADISSSEMSQRAAELFKPFVFYLSRETPRAPLEFLLKAFGCAKIGWDEVSGAGAFTHNERDERITHQIVDRPPVPVYSEVEGANGTDSVAQSRGRIPGRTYIQPQWVWDCANACKLLRPDLYAPGATLPPHLSPFVKPKPGEYDPSQPLEPDSDAEEEEAAARDEDEREAHVLENEVGIGSDVENTEADAENDEDMVDGIESIKGLADLKGTGGSESEEDAAEPEADDVNRAAARNDASEDGFGGFSDASDSDEYQQELKAESTGKSANSAKSKSHKASQERREKKRKQQHQDAEKKQFQKMLMPRKKRELYDRMAYSKAQKDTVQDKLRAKRRKIELSNQ